MLVRAALVVRMVTAVVVVVVVGGEGVTGKQTHEGPPPSHPAARQVDSHHAVPTSPQSLEGHRSGHEGGKDQSQIPPTQPQTHEDVVLHTDDGKREMNVSTADYDKEKVASTSSDGRDDATSSASQKRDAATSSDNHIGEIYVSVVDHSKETIASTASHDREEAPSTARSDKETVTSGNHNREDTLHKPDNSKETVPLTANNDKETTPPTPHSSRETIPSTTNHNEKSPNQDPRQQKVATSTERRRGGIVLVTLGWGEDEAVMSAMAELLHDTGHDVTVIIYGPRRSAYTGDVEVLEIPTAEDDPMFPGGVGTGMTAGEVKDGLEWAVSGRVVRSRVCACRQLNEQTWVEERMSTASLIVTPLFLHDVCTLSVGGRVGVPVVGVVTSRVGAWWVWEQLDLLPPLSTHPVPPHTMDDFGLWSRLANLARHYGYLSTIRQSWQVPATTTLTVPSKETLSDLYQSLAGVVVAWDPILDPTLPTHPAVVPIGAINIQPGLMAKDVLVPALLNRAGVVTVSVRAGEAWVGPEAHSTLRRVLQSTSYVILWREEAPSPPATATQDPPPTAKFAYKPEMPVSDILNHPRHRLLISCCGESEVMAAVYFGSPLLCLPVTADQHLAATQVQKWGLGVTIPASEVAVERVKAAIQTLLGDRKLFRKRITQLTLLQRGNADIYLLLLLLLTVVSGLLIYLLLALLPFIMAKTKHKKD